MRFSTFGALRQTQASAFLGVSRIGISLSLSYGEEEKIWPQTGIGGTREKHAKPHGEDSFRHIGRSVEAASMNTSQGMFLFSNPVGDEAVPDGALAYFRARNRGRIYDM